jgi:hypothetical protein
LSLGTYHNCKELLICELEQMPIKELWTIEI